MGGFNFSVSREDILRSKIVKPGMYVLTIKKIDQGPGKKDPTSTTTTIDFEITSGPDPAGVGVPIRHYISEKAAGLAVDFLEAAFGSKIPDDGVQLDLTKLIGRTVKAFIKPDKFNGRDQNKIEGFAPVGK